MSKLPSHHKQSSLTVGERRDRSRTVGSHRPRGRAMVGKQIEREGVVYSLLEVNDINHTTGRTNRDRNSSRASDQPPKSIGLPRCQNYPEHGTPQSFELLRVLNLPKVRIVHEPRAHPRLELPRAQNSPKSKIPWVQNSQSLKHPIIMLEFPRAQNSAYVRITQSLEHPICQIQPEPRTPHVLDLPRA